MVRKSENLALMDVVQSAINNLVKCIDIFASKLTADRGRSQKISYNTKQKKKEKGKKMKCRTMSIRMALETYQR